MRSCDDVHDELAAHDIPHEIVRLPSSTRSAPLAAEALGVDVGHVVKSLLFVLDEERPVLALVTGDATVDAEVLASETGAAQIRLARTREVRSWTGYHPGGVSPCALATDVPVVADPGVFMPETVYCGGGTETTMLKIRSAHLEALLQPRRLRIARRQPAWAAGADGPADGGGPSVPGGHQRTKWRA